MGGGALVYLAAGARRQGRRDPDAGQSRWRKGDDWQGYLEHLLVRLHKQRTGLERSEKAADPTRLTYIQQAEKELTRLREQLMEGVWPL